MLDLIREHAPRGIVGVVVGIVTNNQDPDGMGRVKVRFPWRDDADESFWARIATLMAGPGRGSYFLPEVEDEVLVAFDHGDIHHPYVLGALWNGQDTPPASNSDGKNNVRKITSRSGHEIILDDNTEQQQARVTIQSQAGHQIVLDDAAGQEKIAIADKSGNNTVVIDSAQNSIAIQSQMRLSLKASTLEIEADTTLTIKAGATLTIQGSLVKIN
ncbi:MAG: phage baseplate assembly protein V [Candidatus Tectimicrobiota bacterium]